MKKLFDRWFAVGVAGICASLIVGAVYAAPQALPALDVQQKLTTYGNQVAGHQVATCSPANQTGITSTAALVMLGLGAAASPCTFTPQSTGNVQFTLTGILANGTSADGCSVQLSFGTGAAPANAAAVTGTQVGTLKAYVAVANAQQTAMPLIFEVTGLTLGTPVWYDVALKAVTGGTCTYNSVDGTAVEN